MYALIYDDRDSDKGRIKIISVHDTRDESDKALLQRQKDFGRRVFECNTRIVWTEKTVKPGEFIKPKDFMVWRPEEDIPHGELFSDAD